MTNLQLALDLVPSIDEAIALVEKVKQSIDIIEIGTPFIMREGMHGVRAMKANFPGKEILADLKIMDGGFYEAEMAFKAGADYITVLAVTDLVTIKNCVEAAKRSGGKVVVDMLCIEDLASRIKELEALDVDYLAVHVGVDQQATGRTPLDDLKIMKAHVTKAKIAVAGGINHKTLPAYISLSPDIIIIGSGITGDNDPAEKAREIKTLLG